MTIHRPRGPVFGVLLFVLLVLVAVPLYGYWHVIHHGVFSVSVYGRSADGRLEPLKGVNVTLHDDSARVLATGESDLTYGVVYLEHPETGSCYKEERSAFDRAGRDAWLRCFETHARWIPGWADRVAAVDVDTGDCMLQGIPVEVSRYRDNWWLWWTPHPHLGGKPYTYFNLMLTLDTRNCEPVLLG